MQARRTDPALWFEFTPTDPAYPGATGGPTSSATGARPYGPSPYGRSPVDAWAVAAYLAAAVAANLAVAEWGQAALVLTATLLIPFDLFARDVLHDRWGKSRWLWPRMAALVAAGGALSYLANADARMVAVASCSAFLMAGATDAVVYHALRRRPRVWRMNASNAVSAVVDSVAFPLIAFAALDPWLSASQAALKVLGGAGWTALYVWLRRRGGRPRSRRPRSRRAPQAQPPPFR